MANRKENLKSLFSNTRSRVIILFTLAILLFGILFGYFKLRHVVAGEKATANVAYAPGGIKSIPGSLEPTAQYAKLQQEQNVSQAVKASESGKSAIPTIIQTRGLGQGVGVIGSKEGEVGVGFSTLAREELGGTQQSLWLQALKDGNCSKPAVQKIIEQGAQLIDIKAACSCVKLKDIGYNLQDLQPVCECKELRAAGYNAEQLKQVGYTAGRLKACGFNACEVANAGFSVRDMKDGGFSDGELKGAGFSDDDIAKASGLPEGITADDVRKAGCDAAALAKLRQQGVTASAIRRISGCSAEQLKAAGFSAKDLKDAGYSAADLKRAGFKPEELKAAGFSARDLLNAGFNNDDLAKAGFSPEEIMAAQVELPPGISANDVKNAGCDVDVLKRQREAGVSAALIKQHAGCSAQALKAAGYSDEELANAGFSPDQIKKAANVPTDDEIKAAGCDSDKLKQLLQAGVSAKRIRDLNGCSAQALKNAGYDLKSLQDAGFTPAELLAAGFTDKQIADAGTSPAALIAAGRNADCSPEYLKKARAAGISALTIKKTLGCSAKALKDAGYSAKDLKDAGFTAAELKDAGFTPAELKAAGFTAKELKDAGFTPKELKDAGFSAKDLKDAGFTAAELKDAGFTPAQLKSAGFSAKDLKDAGLSAADLAKLGFKAKDLKDAGFSAADLKNAGFSPKDLKDAGFTAAELVNAGFTAKDLKDAGFTAAEAANSGLTAQQLRNAGYLVPATMVAGMENPNLVGQTTNLTGIPSIARGPAGGPGQTAAANAEQLQALMQKQGQQLAEQKYQQKIQQKTSDMASAANTMISDWKKVSTQVFVPGANDEKAETEEQIVAGASVVPEVKGTQETITTARSAGKNIIKTGDVLFAVIDTSINSDEPGPILATIVSGKLKGAKLIGSFNLPGNSDEMVISFNTLSVPGAEKTISIQSVAIDPNTARTALSSKTNHHYLMRYGSLFASSFLQGFGNAIQTANTTVTIGGTGGGNDVTFSSGIGQSTLENAVIGLSTVGKAWGQQAQQNMSRPTTVQVFSGTGVGILFTQDVTIV